MGQYVKICRRNVEKLTVAIESELVLYLCFCALGPYILTYTLAITSSDGAQNTFKCHQKSNFYVNGPLH